MHKLAGGDITKLGQVTKTNLYECLTWLTYEDEIEEIKNNKI